MLSQIWRSAARLVLVVAAASSAAVCSPAGTADGPTLRVGFGIGNSARGSIRNLTDVLYVESLLARSWDGRHVERLVSAWRWEEDGRALRLRIRPGVKLHDGTDLSAALVTDVLRRAAADKDLGFEHVSGISSPEPGTILIHLTRPDLFLLNGLADRRIVKPGNPDMGTGPFRIVTREPSVRAARFEQYHGGRPELAGIEVVTYDTTRSAWAALMRNDVDAVQEVNADAVDFMKDASAVQIYTTLQPFHIPLVFNLAHPVLAHVEVRRAMAEALDREAIIERAMRGQGRVADGPIWPHHWAYTAHPRRWRYAPESARARLERAGFRMRPGPRSEPISRFRIRCLVYDEDPQYERIALMLQRQLFDVGIDLEIELADLGTIGTRVLSGDFETYLVRANAGRSMDYTYRFWHSGLRPPLALHKSGYSGADAALDQLRASLTDAELRSAISRLAERFHDDVPAVFIAWLEVTRAVSQRFEVGEGSQDPLFNLWRWRPAQTTP